MKSEAERFWAKVSKDGHGGCWLWTASLQNKGYGQFRVGGTMVLAHRWLYERTKGPVPEGLELDHLCRVHRCVNSDHLEPVTHLENIRRGVKGVLTTHCPQGHAYSPSNVRFRKNGHRYCRACNLERGRRNYAKRRMEQSA